MKDFHEAIICFKEINCEQGKILLDKLFLLTIQ